MTGTARTHRSAPHETCGTVRVRASNQQEGRRMLGRSVPGRPGRRWKPGGRGHRHAIDDGNGRKPGQPRSDKQRRDRGNAPAVCADVTLGAMRITQRLVRGRNHGVAAMAGGDLNRCRMRKHIQAAAMTGQRALRPEQRSRRKKHGALEPLPLAKTGHDVSLPLAHSDATDPDQRGARPGACSDAAASGFAGAAADLARRSALATTETELRLMASAATIGLSRIPNAG